MTSRSEAVDMEAEVAALLGELSDVQQELLDVLALKRDRMAACDQEGMVALQPREEELCDRLQACHERRQALLARAARQGLPADSLAKLTASLPRRSRGKLAKQVKEAAAQMRILQHHSLTNWVLAQRTVLHLAQLLEIIATGGRLQPTYGRGESAASTGALVNRQA